MRKLILLLFMVMVSIQVNGQYGQDYDWEENQVCGDLIQLKQDIKSMYKCLDDLNDDVLKSSMDILKKGSNTTYWKERVAKDTVKIKNNIAFVKQAFKDESSCFYKYVHKERQDYLQSLESLKNEMSGLFPRNAYSDNEFISAYHYMSSSRANLMAAMDNLYRYHLIRNETQTQLPLKMEAVKKEINSVEEGIKAAKAEINKNIKKQSMLCGLLGGIVGGIVGGLIMMNN